MAMSVQDRIDVVSFSFYGLLLNERRRETASLNHGVLYDECVRHFTSLAHKPCQLYVRQLSATPFTSVSLSPESLEEKYPDNLFWLLQHLTSRFRVTLLLMAAADRLWTASVSARPHDAPGALLNVAVTARNGGDTDAQSVSPLS